MERDGEALAETDEVLEASGEAALVVDITEEVKVIADAETGIHFLGAGLGIEATELEVEAFGEFLEVRFIVWGSGGFVAVKELVIKLLEGEHSGTGGEGIGVSAEGGGGGTGGEEGDEIGVREGGFAGELDLGIGG